MTVEKAKLAYTLDEAAEAVGVSTYTLRKAHDDGLLPFRYTTSKPLIKAADLIAWLDNAPKSAAERKEVAS